MQVLETGLEGVRIIEPKRFSDNRGYFEETYNRNTYRKLGIEQEFVQDNHSMSKNTGTVRGLHFQTEPFVQAKLVTCISGALNDFAVDLRVSSPTFLKFVSVELSEANGRMLYIPIGFAHGFCTIMPNTRMVYKVSNFYSVDHDGGVFWNDPDIGIDWGIPMEKVTVSEKDQNLPTLQQTGTVFP